MKASIILAGVSAMMASAAPMIEERVVHTKIVKHVVHVTKTEFVTAPKATANNVVVVQAAPAEPEPVVKVKTVVHKVQYRPAPSSTKKNNVVYTTIIKKPAPTVEAPAVYVAPVQEEPKTTKTTKKKVTPKPTAEAEDDSLVIGNIDLETNSYETIMLHYHNIHRANHSAPALEWSDELAGYAEQTANNCKLEHDFVPGGGGYGQNLAYWSTTADDLLSKKNWCAASGITNQWYNGEMDNYASYGQANPPESQPLGDYGHFTQLVWKHSTKVGCATVSCPTGFAYPALMTVCNYNPVGNVGGGYGANVLAPTNKKRVTL